MKSSAPLKINATSISWLLLLPLIVFLGCKSKWPCDVSNPYGYSANDGAALDPYAQPTAQPYAQPPGQQYFQPADNWNPPTATPPPVGGAPQFVPSAQSFQPPVVQPLNDGSGTVNPFSQPPANPYGSISPTGGGFNTNTTIP